MGSGFIDAMGIAFDNKFIKTATEVKQPHLKLTWLTEKPVWIAQWPLKGERPQKAKELVVEQLAAGHIRPSTSPCNTPIFIILKKSAINNQVPMDRYEWTVLLKGMKNSPTICQFVVGSAIQPTRTMYPDAIIYHYMDDILIATQTESDTQLVFTHLKFELEKCGLKLAPEKIQMEPPWKYLGWFLLQRMLQLHIQVKRPKMFAFTFFELSQFWDCQIRSKLTMDLHIPREPYIFSLMTGVSNILQLMNDDSHRNQIHKNHMLCIRIFSLISGSDQYLC
ncbi:hypothetical protein BTVI_53906 [Pitangus sulphuratus]|nr:hypothetical protein BTVI_53906 [Pitangus sulphuratus]